MSLKITQTRTFQDIQETKGSPGLRNEIKAAAETRIMALIKWVTLISGSGAAIFIPFYMASYSFKPGDSFSRLIGIIGSAMMFVGASFYVIRKRVRKLNRWGNIKDWLDIHILLCLFGPLLIVYHSGFTVTATNSAIAYYSMMVVVGSGVIGRYIYRHFQVSLSGERATLRKLKEEIEQLDEKIKTSLQDSGTLLDSIIHFFGLRNEQGSIGFFKSIYLMLKFDFLERKLKKQILKYLKEKKYHILEGSLEDILVKRISLEKKVSNLEATSKLFSVWHKLHVPFIWILIVAFFIHIAAAMIF
ncbi:MAG: hypothetical protein ACYDBV_10705 [Nitrospiria bacterium]